MGYLAVMIGTALCVATRKLPGVVVLSVVLDSPENEHILASTFFNVFFMLLELPSSFISARTPRLFYPSLNCASGRTEFLYYHFASLKFLCVEIDDLLHKPAFTPFLCRREGNMKNSAQTL